VVENGGYGGAWQNRSNTAETIDIVEARRLALEWGIEAEEVALRTNAVKA
jgi:hypothetical protein